MPNPIATFTTSMGVFKAEIYLDKMPITASNFIDLCNTKFYEGVPDGCEIEHFESVESTLGDFQLGGNALF